MRITAEMAKRIEERVNKGRKPPVSDDKKMEILVDWLEGKTYKELHEKHKIAKTSIAKIIQEAKKEASLILKKELR